jgi:hypothetical protein
MPVIGGVLGFINNALGETVNTKGNNMELSDAEKGYYMWNSPISLSTGDAQGYNDGVMAVDSYVDMLKGQSVEQAVDEYNNKVSKFKSANSNAEGGPLTGIGYSEPNIFATGGTHGQNPNGGIQVGTGTNGKPNLVEEGEVKVTIKGKDYIISDRIKIEV